MTPLYFPSLGPGGSDPLLCHSFFTQINLHNITSISMTKLIECLNVTYFTVKSAKCE